jgi:hypothetical protein
MKNRSALLGLLLAGKLVAGRTPLWRKVKKYNIAITKG